MEVNDALFLGWNLTQLSTLVGILIATGWVKQSVQRRYISQTRMDRGARDALLKITARSYGLQRCPLATTAVRSKWSSSFATSPASMQACTAMLSTHSNNSTPSRWRKVYKVL